MTASAAAAVLAKITSKNQLTLPKSVTQALGPVQYFEVQTKGGQIILTPVRIQRGDAVRAKLAELALDEADIAAALDFAAQAQEVPAAAPTQPPARKAVAKKPKPAKSRSSASAGRKPAVRKAAAR
ncbi:AbrB/MazE/SpoVT family DNA-binding domain-containing protein [Roseateles sp.]|jgi:translation initiation factor IF-1|uniref:AbrB/MazE/SpoVT family DNA-binding domain-containing protein n=1 Tax=Roseateles sp. TaxID=1971397 RepID=UPI003919CF09